MKTKTDLYTKVVLTTIAVFLGIIVFKDITFVTKAQASELDLSALKIENASDEEGMTFFIYENSSLSSPFDGFNGRISPFRDEPKYIITNKKGTINL